MGIAPQAKLRKCRRRSKDHRRFGGKKKTPFLTKGVDPEMLSLGLFKFSVI